MTVIAGQILTAAEMEAIAGLDQQRQALADERQDLVQKTTAAAALGQDQGRAEARDQAAAAIAKQVDMVEAHLAETLNNLSDYVTHIVQNTLDEILGEFTDAALIERVVGKKIADMSGATQVRLITAADVAGDVERALGQHGRPDWRVTVNEELEDGRVMVETPMGYMDIGPKQQTRVAKNIIAKRIALDIMDRPLWEDAT